MCLQNTAVFYLPSSVDPILPFTFGLFKRIQKTAKLKGQEVNVFTDTFEAFSSASYPTPLDLSVSHNHEQLKQERYNYCSVSIIHLSQGAIGFYCVACKLLVTEV